jgi:hypothetical protein
MKLISFFFVSIFSFSFVLPLVHAQESLKLKDFRGTPQTLALLGAVTEFVEPAQRDVFLESMRRSLNRFTRSFGQTSISGFKLGQNLNDQFFKPVRDQISSEQKAFLKAAATDNSVDILALSQLADKGDGRFELELQLFDSRTEVLSGIERADFDRNSQARAFDDLAYRTMNYLDAQGFVFPQPQNFLERPMTLGGGLALGSSAMQSESFSLNPQDLNTGGLGGQASIAGEKTPFWETWWFWTLVGGGLAGAGALTYYFTVVDKDPSRGTIQFQLP